MNYKKTTPGGIVFIFQPSLQKKKLFYCREDGAGMERAGCGWWMCGLQGVVAEVVVVGVVGP